MSSHKMGKIILESSMVTLSLKDVNMFVFDMAGTCVNEGGLVYSTIKKCLGDYNIDIKNLKNIGGMSKKQVIEHYVDKEFYNKEEAIYEVNRHYYRARKDKVSKEQIDQEIKGSISRQIYYNFQKELLNMYKIDGNIATFDGTYDLFHNLKDRNIKVCLNTGYPEEIAECIINKLGFKGLIDGYIASNMVEEGRPAPYMINKLIADHNIKTSKNVIKVGDTVVDMAEGENVGVRYNIGVLTGVNNRDELWRGGADLVLPSIKDINKLLL